MLVLLPPGERRLEFAEPMGTPAVLSTRLAELLPGTTFDADRRGKFRRGGYEITFEFVAEHTAIAQATGIVVTVLRGEGFTALKRIVEKTGWQAVDPTTLNPVDLDKSRATGSVAVQSGAPAPGAAYPAKAQAPRHQKMQMPAMPVMAGASIVLVVVIGILVWRWG